MALALALAATLADPTSDPLYTQPTHAMYTRGGAPRRGARVVPSRSGLRRPVDVVSRACGGAACDGDPCIASPPLRERTDARGQPHAATVRCARARARLLVYVHVPRVPPGMVLSRTLALYSRCACALCGLDARVSRSVACWLWAVETSLGVWRWGTLCLLVLVLHTQLMPRSASSPGQPRFGPRFVARRDESRCVCCVQDVGRF